MPILAFILNRSLTHFAPEAEPRGLKTAPAAVQDNYRHFRFLVEEEAKNFKVLSSMAGGSRP
ncbi:MAG: hypothetical protein EOO78_07785, partial [Oxalobacteraceae bacterium]